jgi:hypothetical protein
MNSLTFDERQYKIKEAFKLKDFPRLHVTIENPMPDPNIYPETKRIIDYLK